MNAVWPLCLCVFAAKPIESAHFMGGLIYWRPLNPAAFDGSVSQIMDGQITIAIARISSLRELMPRM